MNLLARNMSFRMSLLLALAAVCLFAQRTCAADAGRSRLVVLADMGNEPDEEQQMVHMLVCSNEFDVEALIAVTGKYLKSGPRPDLFHKLIDGYAKVVDNLRLHAKGWPTPEHLHAVTAAGQNEYGMADVGPGKSSAGSSLILRVAEADDPRPIVVVVNAGSNTLAQALVDYRASHSQKETDRFVAKFRVFENGAQDNAGAWICHNFPKIHWIRSNYQTYAYGGPGGRRGDVRTNLGPNYWAPYPSSPQGQHEWLREHVRTGHGPLGELYPERRFRNGRLGFMEGGGTIPWMGLVNRGLYDVDHPSWGGWSGRFTQNKVPNVWSRHADVRADEEKTAPFLTYREVSDVWTDPQDGRRLGGDYTPVWRWRRAMYNDLICRMDWCVKPRREANHHPVAAFDGDATDGIIRRTAAPGDTVALDASGTADPDGDPVEFHWWMYQEAGDYAGEAIIAEPHKAVTTLSVPTGAAGKQIHIILEVQDQNSIAALYDYRRVVVEVSREYSPESN